MLLKHIHTYIHTYINNAYYSAFPQLIKALYNTKIDRIKYKVKMQTRNTSKKSKNEHGTKELEQVRFEFQTRNAFWELNYPGSFVLESLQA